MSENVGLATPRGSGTSGYVQRNLGQLQPRHHSAPYPKDLNTLRHKQRQPDPAILEHDRKREIEVMVFELRDQLEEQEADENQIEERCNLLREKMLAQMRSTQRPVAASRRVFKEHQVHEMADAKIQESEKMRKALGISSSYEEGSYWKRQQERLQTALEKDGDGKTT